MPGLFTAACLVFLPAFASAQGLPPCPAETQPRTVASTNDTATLAGLLQCSNGSFTVEWVGDVIVSQTIYVMQGTSLNVTGASAGGATADGDHTTQLFAVDGASSLHITDMVLANGIAALGGAVSAIEHSSISFGGNMTFAGNFASSHGGGIYLNSSTVVWQGGQTTFLDNSALSNGGAIMAGASSSVSWDGETVFLDNSAGVSGGAVYALDFCNVSWKGDTTFVNNSAYDGGAVMIVSNSRASWDGETAFIDNNATNWGGGLYMHLSSDISWTGNTIFLDNLARDGGGVMFSDYCLVAWSGTTTFAGNTVRSAGGAINLSWESVASWSGLTTFTGNTAYRGGALWVDSASSSWTGTTTFTDNVALLDGGAVYGTINPRIRCQGTTTFRNNTAIAGNGGGLAIFGRGAVDNVPYVNISGEATFTGNRAFQYGGAVFSSSNPDGQYFEGVTFEFNSASIGGAVATFGTGNGNELTASPTRFSRCQFLNNVAAETGGAIETAFGHEEIYWSHFENNSAGEVRN